MNILQSSTCYHILLLNLLETHNNQIKFDMPMTMNTLVFIDDIKKFIPNLNDTECKLIYDLLEIHMFGIEHTTFSLSFNKKETNLLISLFNYLKQKYKIQEEEEEIIVIGDLDMI